MYFIFYADRGDKDYGHGQAFNNLTDALTWEAILPLARNQFLFINRAIPGKYIEVVAYLHWSGSKPQEGELCMTLNPNSEEELGILLSNVPKRVNSLLLSVSSPLQPKKNGRLLMNRWFDNAAELAKFYNSVIQGGQI